MVKLSLAIGIVLALQGAAYGATYNIYFNNAEQGANSTAAPSIVVKDAEEGSKAETEKAAAPAAGAENPPAAPVGESTTTRPLDAILSKKPRNPFRFIGAASSAEVSTRRESAFSSSFFSSSPFREEFDRGHKGGFSFTASYFFTPEITGGLVVGPLSGIEGGYVVSIGPGAYQIELLGGGLTLASKPSNKSDIFLGGRFIANMGERVALVAGFRKSLDTDEDFSFSQIEAGLSLRL